MRLQKIRAQNLKGQTFEYALGDGTAIIGPNSTGKTAIMEAIKFVCRGKFPEVKKGSWPEMSVTGEFDKGTLTRSINAKGTVWTTELPLRAFDGLDVPLLDPEHYFGLTERERTNYVFARIKLPASYTADGIIAEIQRLSLEEAHTEVVEKAKADVVFALRGILKDKSLGNLQEKLGVVVENLRTRYTYWNRRAKETQGAVTTLTELKLREKEVAAAPVNLPAEIKAATVECAKFNAEYAALKQQVLEAETTLATKQSLQKYLGEDRIDYDRMIEVTREKQRKVAGDFERLSDSIAGLDLKELEQTLAEAEQEAHIAHNQLSVATSERSGAKKGIKDLEKLRECPYCHGAPKGWRSNLRNLLEDKLAKAEVSIEFQSGRVAGVKVRVADLKKRIEEVKSTRVQGKELHDQIARFSGEIERIWADKKKDKEKRAGWQERLDAIGTATPALFTGKAKEVEASLTEASKKLEMLTRQRLAETRLQQDLVRAGEAAKEHNDAAAQLLVTKTVAKLIEGKREDMVAKTFKTLLETANRFTEGILKSTLVLHENTIGRYQGTIFVEHHWFGGTEKALAYIAIAVALSAAAPFKLVLLDEFGRLDEDNQIKVIRRLFALAKEGVIDQFVVAGTSLPKAVGEGYGLPMGSKLAKIVVK